MELVEQHFRENHKANIIKGVESHTTSGTAARSLRSLELARLVRSVWEDQKRFPLQIATVLSQQFAGHGLQFFKVNKTITHVSVARPHYLDLALTPVSDGVKSIVDYINANPKCTRRRLIEALAPSPASAPVAPAGEGQAAPAPGTVTPTPEQNALIGDLHWLIHQGHVIEFANGTLETAKKPVPRPPKPNQKEEKTAEPAAGTAVAETTTEPASQPGTAETGATEPTLPMETNPAEVAQSPSGSDQTEPVSNPQSEFDKGNAQEAHQSETAPANGTAEPAGDEIPAVEPAAPVESPR
jgi:hypothetical protein